MPVAFFFGTFIVWTMIKGQFASYWALATTKAAPAATPPVTTASVGSPGTSTSTIGAALQAIQAGTVNPVMGPPN